MDDTRLGTLLLEGQVVAEQDLERCLEIQTLTGGSRPIGQILVEQGLVTQPELTRLLELQQSRLQVGPIPAVSARSQVSQAAGDPDRDAGSKPYLRWAASCGANELVVSEGRPPLVKVAGSWQCLAEEPLSGPDVWQFVRSEMGGDVLDGLAEARWVERDYSRSGIAHGRMTAFRHFDGVAVQATVLPFEAIVGHAGSQEPTIPDGVLDTLTSAQGLVIVGTDKGRGRAETFERILGRVAQDATKLIIVLDESFEYLPRTLPENETPQALVQRRLVGPRKGAWAEGLRSALREQPDVLLVGDVGDPDAFDIALRAAEAGQLVVAGLHTRSVVRGVRKVLDFYPSYEVPRVRNALAGVLRFFVVQHQVPDIDHVTMLTASELLMFDEPTRDALRSGHLDSMSLLMRMEDGEHTQSLDHGLLTLLRRGMVRFEDVFNHAEDKAKILSQSPGAKS